MRLRSWILVCLMIVGVSLWRSYARQPASKHVSSVPQDWQSKNAEQRLSDLRKRRTADVTQSLTAAGLKLGDGAFIRILKESDEFQLWMNHASKSWQLYKTFPIARWSGALGPKMKEGDGQAPEGFYDVVPARLNPMSKYHLSFNIGYPNAYDRALQRTGSLIMVHGSNVSIGCFAMTDPGIEEIYVIVAEALKAGQKSVPVHCFPFVMTDDRLTKEAASPHHAFWLNLKEGYDAFEKSHVPPTVKVEYGRYVVIEER